MTNYGTDLALGPGGFAPTLPLASGPTNLIQALYRRCHCDPDSTPGRNIYRGFCVDLRRWFARPMDAGSVGDLGGQLVRAVQSDERVQSATAQVRFVDRRLRVALNVTPSAGPSFTLILATDGVTTELLDGTLV